MTPDTFTRSQWYAIGRLPDFEGAEAKPVRLLSQDLTVSDAAGVLSVNDADGRSLLTQIRYGHLWTTLSDTPRPLYDVPEFDEPDRRLVTAGGVGVRCSGLRCVENFLDMAHFPSSTPTSSAWKSIRASRATTSAWMRKRMKSGRPNANSSSPWLRRRHRAAR